MYTANTSSAYDLSVFEKQQSQNKKTSLKVVESRNKSFSYIFTPKVIGAAAIVVTLISLMLYNQTQITETNHKVNKLNAELELLKSDYVKMSSELESTISLITVGERAESELGMQRLEKYQIEYVYLYQDNEIQRTENTPDPTTAQKLQIRIYSVIDQIKEYIAD